MINVHAYIVGLVHVHVFIYSPILIPAIVNEESFVPDIGRGLADKI
jgi:hypothetical protein